MQWDPRNESPWPGFQDFLKSHVAGLFAQERIRGHFVRTAFKALPPGPLKPFVGMALSIWQIATWGAGPFIWVDVLNNAAAIFSKKEKTIVFNIRIIRTLERDLQRKDYRDAVEMLVMHELLHWAIDRIGGVSEHSPRGGNDLVYDFENAVYDDAAARDKTLENMNI